ncbi:ATP-dependent RNA helicase CshB [Bacilli bacterium PM5-9]|nr:ATP-dependent RNA helicase CshB [Bacilli bacterium PM5-9]
MERDFLDYNFNSEINSVLKKLNFVNPTPIQQQIIPLLRKKQNVVGVSQTGSGKTHAFLLPIIENINNSIKKPQAIIMTPTRELASQIYQNIQDFAKTNNDLKVKLLVGGSNLDEDNLIDAQIVVGTPGRLLDAINNRHVLKLDNIMYMVVDEADMIFDSNFIEEVDKVMAFLDTNVCFSIFSATITKQMHPFLKKYFEGIKIVEINEKANNKIEHIIVPSKGKDKYETLLKLVNTIDPYLCLIFASKKTDVIELANKLASDGIKCIQLHGDLSSRERMKTLKRINNLEFNFVVASDIAARGIDIDGVSHVISYDMPKELEYYIHRVGRTGRHKYTGISYFIYDNNDEKAINRLEEKGLTFNFYDFTNGVLEPAGLRTRTQKVLKSDNYDSKIVNKVVKKKKEKVKPGYKKKRKLALEKQRKNAKQQEIKERIKKQRKQRKKSNENSSDNFEF